MPNSGSRIPRRFRVPIQEQIGICIQERLSSGAIHAVMEMEGRVDFPRFSRAVRLSLDAQPILGCRLVLHWLRPAWERRDDLDRIELCRLIETSNAQDALLECLTTPMSPLVDPLVAMRVIRGATDTLCLTMSHMACDGMGMKEYGRLLTRIYRRLGENPHYLPEPKVSGWRTIDQLWGRFGWRQRLAMVACLWHSLRARRRAGRWRLPVPDGGPTDGTYVMRRLPRERIQPIRQFAHEQGAAMNDMFVTAYFRALAALVPHTDAPLLPVVTAIDLRQYLPPSVRKESGICNLTGACRVDLPIREGASFADDLRRVVEQMEVFKHSYVGVQHLPALMLLSKLAYLLPFSLIRSAADRFVARMAKGAIRGAAVLTNGGFLPRGSFTFDDFQPRDGFAVTGMVTLPGVAMVLCVTWCDGMMFSVGFKQNALDRAAVEKILEHIDRDLCF